MNIRFLFDVSKQLKAIQLQLQDLKFWGFYIAKV